MTQRRPPIFGPEPWATVAGADWCHFDRWFAMVAAGDFGGDLDALEAELVGRLRSLHGRGDVEAKLSHLADLRDRMGAAGIDAAVLGAADEADKATLAKARRKVLDQGLEDRSMTPAMRDTPSARLRQRALYGHWDRFPVSPDRWYEKLAGRRPATHVPKGRTFTLTRELGERLARLDGPRRAQADRLALYRAFHTVGVELAERGDDSYGNIGELRAEAFDTYLGIDWVAAGMAPEHWWQDLCELLVSEVYALTYERETLAFRHVPAGQADLVEGILLGLAGEWRNAYQDYQADEARQLVAWLHIAGRRYSRYPSAAHRLGSEHWMPIVALAESAAAAGRRELAVEVFRAADQPGMHRDHLRERCLKAHRRPPRRPAATAAGRQVRGPFDVMPTRRRPPPTTALDALSGAEHTRILAELLHSHPELRSEAEDAARRLLDDASVDAIAESVASALEELPLDALAMRSGRIRGRGYVHETEAAGKSSKKRSSLFSPTCGGAPSWAWVPLWTSRQE